MSRKKQLFIIVCAVFTITSVASHLAVWFCKIRTDAVSPLNFGNANRTRSGIVAGSSLMFYGADWAEITRSFDLSLKGWAVPAGSVVEMEVLQSKMPPAQITFIGVSVSDLNENYVSDFRAEIVPLARTLSSLWEARSKWTFARRVLSQYPLLYLRKVFPSAGRATGIMVGIRAGLRELIQPKTAQTDPGERAVVVSASNTHQENINSWPKDRLVRNIGDMRASAGGKFDFNGPKRHALNRFMQNGAKSGKVVVLVMPLSPVYEREFLTDEVRKDFDEELAETQKKLPDAIWIRLDTAPELKSNENYWDLVHLNAHGQAIATKIVLEHLATAGIR